MDRVRLRKRSIEVITGHQAKTGAYVASPNFHQYRFSWLRDGSFIAYGMLLEGHPESTERFLKWTSDTVVKNQPDWRSLEQAVANGTSLPKGAHMPTRFSVDGTLGTDEWPDFQIDGYGAFLWLLSRWCQTMGREIPEWASTAVEVTIAYLSRTWNLPNYDPWEENGSNIHPATLACVFAGLTEMSRWGIPVSPPPDSVRELALSRPTPEGTLPKFLGSAQVDASLLWCAVPFGMVDPESDLMMATVGKIESDLLRDGGVHRYSTDTYYGGGRWILLTAWLGWYYVQVGRLEEAKACAAWIESKAGVNGDLPEQVTDEVNSPDHVKPWVDRWGAVADPLLWSHAMYLVLIHELEKTTDGVGEKTIHKRRRSL